MVLVRAAATLRAWRAGGFTLFGVIARGAVADRLAVGAALASRAFLRLWVRCARVGADLAGRTDLNLAILADSAVRAGFACFRALVRVLAFRTIHRDLCGVGTLPASRAYNASILAKCAEETFVTFSVTQNHGRLLWAHRTSWAGDAEAFPRRQVLLIHQEVLARITGCYQRCFDDGAETDTG